MNFFAHQELARKQTRRMIVLFTIAVICIVIAVDAVVMIAFGIGREGRRGAIGANTGALVASTLGVLAVIGLATLYRISTLRAGGSAVALQLGATAVPADTTEFAYRRLRNVIEEIAIASGVPVPEIFVLEEETAINAFASGYTPADAAVTVTRGCLDKLTRDELQGVIAHEFSHVLNGDMRLNIRLVGVAFGILVLAVIGRKTAESSSMYSMRSSGYDGSMGRKAAPDLAIPHTAMTDSADRSSATATTLSAPAPRAMSDRAIRLVTASNSV